MAYSLLGHVGLAGSSGGGTTSSVDTTGATLIVIHVARYIGSGTVSVTDNKSNTYTPLTERATVSQGASSIWYCAAPTVGSGHTFTVTAASFFGAAEVAVFSGAAASPFDQQNGNAASASPGSVTPTENNELVVTGFTTAGGTGYAASGYTVTDSADYNSGVNVGGALGYVIQTTATATNPTWTGGSGQSAATIATFKAVAASGNTIAVPKGSLTLTGKTPTVSATQNNLIRVPAGSLTLTGRTPSVVVGNRVSVPAASLTLTGKTPVVVTTQNNLVRVPAGSLTLTGYPPTVRVGINIAVPSGSLSLTGNAPTVSTTQNNLIRVPAGSLHLTGYAPTVSNGAISGSTGAVILLPVRLLSGVYTTTGVTASRALQNLRSFLPNANVQVLQENGTMNPNWYKFFQRFVDVFLGGAGVYTLQDILDAFVSSQEQATQQAAFTQAVAQQAQNVAEAAAVMRQVAVDNSLTGAEQIPLVQLSHGIEP